jgi:hypothetical protein
MWWAALLFAVAQVIQDRWCGLPLNFPAQMAIPLQMDSFPSNSWSLQ